MGKTLYRVVKIDRIESFKQGFFQEACKPRIPMPGINNFNYEEGKAYLHFFENKEDAIMYHNCVLKKRHPDIQFCLLEFKVKNKILVSSRGEGQYSFKKDVTEYAVESELLSTKTVKLVKISKLKQNEYVFG